MNQNNRQPAWKNAQQKRTKAENKQERQAQQAVEPVQIVKIRMKTDYRDIVKAGEVWETDADKAAELVKLNRAEYL